MTSTEQLERETELCRQQLLGTMTELRTRLTPRQMVNHAIEYVSDGDGAEFARNLKTQIVANPLPTTLMGAGLAWLMLAGRTKPAASDSSGTVSSGAMSSGGMRGAVHDARDGAGEFADGAAEAGRGMMDAAGSAAAGIRDAAASAAEAAGGAYEGVADRAARGASAAADAARNLGQNARATSRSFADFCREQPLMLAGLGIAIGAALGALLPGTEMEDSVMGEAADDIRDEARQTANEAYEKAAAVADSALDAGVEEAGRQGFIDGGPSDAGDDAATLVPEHPEEPAPARPASKPVSAPILDP